MKSPMGEVPADRIFNVIGENNIVTIQLVAFRVSILTITF